MHTHTICLHSLLCPLCRCSRTQDSCLSGHSLGVRASCSLPVIPSNQKSECPEPVMRKTPRTSCTDHGDCQGLSLGTGSCASPQSGGSCSLLPWVFLRQAPESPGRHSLHRWTGRREAGTMGRHGRQQKPGQWAQKSLASGKTQGTA